MKTYLNQPFEKGLFFGWIMSKINKAFNLKLICMLLVGMFLCNAPLYPHPDTGDALRVPLDTERLEDLQGATKKTQGETKKSPEELRLDKERIATFIALKTTDHSGTRFDVRRILGPITGFLELLGDEDYLDDRTDIKTVMMELAKEIRTEIAKHRELTMSAQEYGYEDVLNIPEDVIGNGKRSCRGLQRGSGSLKTGLIMNCMRCFSRG